MINALKAIPIGVALIAPGLSASIFAIIVGLYEKGLFAIANFRKEPLKHLKFLLPIAIGAGIGVLAAARVLSRVMEAFPAPAYLFFCGLIIGSGPMVYRKVFPKNSAVPFEPKYLIGSVITLATMVFMAYLGDNQGHDQVTINRLSSPEDFFAVFFAGLLSASMMAIPGVSGSIMIIILGQLGNIYNAISQTLSLLRHVLSGNWEAASEAFAAVLILLPFALGTLIGGVTIAKIMVYIIERAERLVYYCVGGALLGTVIILFDMGVWDNLPSANLADIAVFSLTGIAALAAGAVCTIWVTKRAK